jgi:ribonuclease P protein component
VAAKKNIRKTTRLLKRSEFLRTAATQTRFVAPAFILQFSAPAEGVTFTRYGLTATKKLGDAVTPNRARRRLRELAKAILLTEAAPGDYVLIARSDALTRDYAQMVKDLQKALSVLKCRK